jgi:hypothetical protein
MVYPGRSAPESPVFFMPGSSPWIFESLPHLSPSDSSRMHLKDLKKKSPADLVTMAEELGVEGASTLRKQDLLFAILKAEAENGEQIMGEGTIEVLTDGFGFLRRPRGEFPGGPGRYLCFAQPGPQVWPAHRRHGGRRDPRAQGWRALLRSHQAHLGQFR